MTEKYPVFRDSETVQFDKVFNGQLCHHTGRERWDSPDIADRWFEYVDSEGDLYYGR